MAKKTGLVVTIRVDGARETLAALRRLPKDASNELRNASLKLSQSLATRARAAAVAEGGQAALMAPTVKARRDRVPSVQAGGAKRVGRHRVPAYKLLFASEFGQNARTGWYGARRYARSTGRQYRPHQGRKGIWFFPTVEAQQFNISQEWRRSADAVVAAFSRDGD